MSDHDEPKRLIARDEEIEDDGALSIGEADDADDSDSPDECPAGGEHEVVEIGAATNRGQPLFTYCRRCRGEL
jgi:hypothetical protein